MVKKSRCHPGVAPQRQGLWEPPLPGGRGPTSAASVRGRLQVWKKVHCWAVCGGPTQQPTSGLSGNIYLSLYAACCLGYCHTLHVRLIDCGAHVANHQALTQIRVQLMVLCVSDISVGALLSGTFHIRRHAAFGWQCISGCAALLQRPRQYNMTPGMLFMNFPADSTCMHAVASCISSATEHLEQRSFSSIPFGSCDISSDIPSYTVHCFMLTRVLLPTLV